MIEGAIHNPANPDHYMQLDRLDQTVRVFYDGEEIAATNQALRLLEAGRRLYQPQYYIPEADISASLVRVSKQTHCPLKGDAAYFDLLGEADTRAESLGWAYPDPFDFASQLAGHIAFDPKRVTITVEAAGT